MACSKIAAPSPPYPMQLPLLCRRHSSLAGSFKGLPLKQSLFRGGSSFLRELTLSANSQSVAGKPAYFPALQVVNAQKKQVNSGSKSEGNVLKSNKPTSDGTNALAVTEGVCIAVAAASYTTSVFRNRRSSLVASSSAGESKFLPKVGDLSTWYVPALWAALLINAIMRTVQQRSSKQPTQKVWDEKSIKDFTLDQRVGKLEEDMKGVAAIAQMLARHLEKLGVRFRVTRRTLRDPIQEVSDPLRNDEDLREVTLRFTKFCQLKAERTVVLSQKTSEVVRALASREQVLEKELEETQRVLVAMQAQQAKQLELLVAGMTKTFKSQQASEQRILNELSRRLGKSTDTSKDIGAIVSALKEKSGVPASKKQKVMQDIGTLWKGLVPNSKTSNRNSSSSEKKSSLTEVGNVELKEGQYKENGYARVTPETKEGPSKKSTSNAHTSFAKEDFWATATPRESSDFSATAQTERQTDAQPQTISEPQNGPSSGRLDSFFSNKKRVHTPKGDTPTTEKDFNDPGFDQVYSKNGEHSSNSNHIS